tara:strand:- start:19 stop:330 length:312 start_codon:yes stop_codon:yes gene_type:complete
MLFVRSLSRNALHAFERASPLGKAGKDGFSLQMLCDNSILVVPVNGGFPYRHKYKETPRLHISPAFPSSRRDLEEIKLENDRALPVSFELSFGNTPSPLKNAA